MIVLYALGVVVFLIVPIAIAIRWYSLWHLPSSPTVPSLLTSPPPGITPAFAAIILGEKDRGRMIIGTLFDLARRGYMTIRQIPYDIEFQ